MSSTMTARNPFTQIGIGEFLNLSNMLLSPSLSLRVALPAPSASRPPPRRRRRPRSRPRPRARSRRRTRRGDLITASSSQGAPLLAYGGTERARVNDTSSLRRPPLVPTRLRDAPPARPRRSGRTVPSVTAARRARAARPGRTDPSRSGRSRGPDRRRRSRIE